MAKKRKSGFHKSADQLAQEAVKAIFGSSISKDITPQKQIEQDAENGYFDDAVSDPELWDKWYGAILRGEKPSMG